MSKLPSNAQSAGVSIVLFIITFALLQIKADTFASSKGLTIVGGFISSLLFTFLLTFLNNVKGMFIRDAASGWVEVIFALSVACSIGGSVHPVCVTTCAIFSLVFAYLLNELAHDTYRVNAPAAPATKSKRR